MLVLAGRKEEGSGRYERRLYVRQAEEAAYRQVDLPRADLDVEEVVAGPDQGVAYALVLRGAVRRYLSVRIEGVERAGGDGYAYDVEGVYRISLPEGRASLVPGPFLGGASDRVFISSLLASANQGHAVVRFGREVPGEGADPPASAARSTRISYEIGDLDLTTGTLRPLAVLKTPFS